MWLSLVRRDANFHLDTQWPLEILENVGKVAYRLALLPKMSGIYNIFYIRMLRKYIQADIYIIGFNDVSYHERPVHILEHGTKKLRNKEISLVKLQWKHKDVREAS